MKTRVLVLTVLSLLVVSSSFVAVLAETTGTYHWSWLMCNAYIDHSTLQIQGGVGSSQIVVSWKVPLNSFENFPTCERGVFSSAEIYLLVTNAGTTGVPVTTSSSASGGTMTFTAYQTICLIHQCITEVYPLRYGNYITVSLTPCYLYNQFCHGTTDTLKVTG